MRQYAFPSRLSRYSDFTRFANPRQMMAYFDLVPGEQSSGETVRRGGITKTGNSHADAPWSKGPGLTG